MYRTIVRRNQHDIPTSRNPFDVWRHSGRLLCKHDRQNRRSTAPSKLHILYGHCKFWMMVDSGSSTSIVTEKMAKDIEARDSNTWWSQTTNPVQLRSYTKTPRKILGTLYCDTECNGWRSGRKDIIVVPNRHRAIVGMDLLKFLGIHFT